MKNYLLDHDRLRLMFRRLLCLCAFLVFGGSAIADPLGTGFSYQGNLVVAGTLANGTFDLQFDLHDAPTGPAAAAEPVQVEDVVVQDGIFTVEIDFGGVLGTDTQYWLEIGVRDGSSDGAYTILTPRQKLFASPLRDAGPAGSGDITGIITAAGSGLEGGCDAGECSLSVDSTAILGTVPIGADTDVYELITSSSFQPIASISMSHPSSGYVAASAAATVVCGKCDIANIDNTCWVGWTKDPGVTPEALTSVQVRIDVAADLLVPENFSTHARLNAAEGAHTYYLVARTSDALQECEFSYITATAIFMPD